MRLFLCLALQVRADETVLEGEALRETVIRSDLDVTQSYAGGEEGIKARNMEITLPVLMKRSLHVVLLMTLSSHSVQTYVNTTLYEKFTYAGIDCSAEEAG